MGFIVRMFNAKHGSRLAPLLATDDQKKWAKLIETDALGSTAQRVTSHKEGIVGDVDRLAYEWNVWATSLQRSVYDAASPKESPISFTPGTDAPVGIGSRVGAFGQQQLQSIDTAKDKAGQLAASLQGIPITVNMTQLQRAYDMLKEMSAMVVSPKISIPTGPAQGMRRQYMPRGGYTDYPVPDAAVTP
jgi:hypothetical protein